MRLRRTLLAALVLTLGLAACGGDDDTPAASGDENTSSTTAAPSTETTAAGGTVTGSLEAEASQQSDGKTLTVSAVTIDSSPGWVSVHADLDGAPGPIVGNASIEEGTSNDVVVTFDEPQQGGTFWPMLHVDAGTVGTYEFPNGPDVPVKDGSDIVMQKVELSVGQ